MYCTYEVRRQSLLPQNGLHYKLFFISNSRLKIGKKKAKAKQQPEAECLKEQLRLLQ